MKPNWKLVSRIGYAFVVLGILILVKLNSILSVNPILISVQIAASVLMVWSRLIFGLRSFHASADATAGGLITKGPYRFVRHPIYSAVLLFTACGMISRPTLSTFASYILITIGIALRIVSEERLIVVKYPGYKEYTKQTKRLIPFVY